jgi:hypothetical protein
LITTFTKEQTIDATLTMTALQITEEKPTKHRKQRKIKRKKNTKQKK